MTKDQENRIVDVGHGGRIIRNIERNGTSPAASSEPNSPGARWI
jgi:hypothetical protein